MKKSIFKINYLLLLCVWFCVLEAKAQEHKVEKKFSKNFNVNAGTSLSIDNKYGEVHINTNSGNEIKVTAIIIGKASSLDKAQKVVDNIAIEVSSENAIQLRTNTNAGSGGSWNKFTSGRNNNVNFEINYEVAMPKNIPLTVNNKFGSVYLGNHEAALTLNVSYGSLKAEKITGSGNKSVKVAFGSGNINFMEKGELNISYSSFEMEGANRLNLTNAFSTVEVSQIGDLVYEGKYGGLKVEKLNSVQGSSAFSKFQIQNLTESLKMSSKYDNDFEVGNIAAGFKEITIDGQFSGIELNFAANSGFSFEADLKFADLKYDKEKAHISKEIKANTSAYYVGKYGNATGESKVKITSKYGDVKFK